MSDPLPKPAPEPTPSASPTPVPAEVPGAAPTGPKPATPPPSNPLAKFPSAVRDAQERFLATGDVAALDAVVLAVILDHQPSIAKKPDAETPADSARLIEDLGFDSLALAEIVFFLEDLYKMTITNEELKNVATMGEIRAFVRSKVGETPSVGETPKVGDSNPT